MRRQPPPGPPPGPDESLDQLIGDWWIYQLARGHRFSTDDVLTAWRASLALPQARRCLDLGCGVGSVGLSTLALLGWEDATLVGVEAQEVSVALARRSVARNGLEGRVRIVQGDIRDPEVLPADASFELITGSPPYIPPGSGIISAHPQRAACRFELRGSCVDYCLAARRWLAPGGRFAFVMVAADRRIEEGPQAAGLQVIERFDVVFREGLAPLIAVMVCARQEDGPFPTRVHGQIAVRRPDGALTEAYAALRAQLGFDPLS
jgi:tRNA1Val (adenine37-N6)-methyltransferase